MENPLQGLGVSHETLPVGDQASSRSNHFSPRLRNGSPVRFGGLPQGGAAAVQALSAKRAAAASRLIAQGADPLARRFQPDRRRQGKGRRVELAEQ
jgi:hypothetical protein